ncbi:MAG: hypothetical protein IH889_03335 [Planctomycetes bacterium]|nr:hypothetical protein [Planctomycetota bacterium]
MSVNLRRKTDVELGDIARDGVQGQQAVVEAMRRLRFSSNVLTGTILVCTVILIALAVVQIALT